MREILSILSDTFGDIARARSNLSGGFSAGIGVIGGSLGFSRNRAGGMRLRFSTAVMGLHGAWE